jgi:flagellar basal-body rod protein FlgC
MKIARLLSGLDLSARGMRAQRRKMDAVAENIANIETTRTDKGGPYRRKIVSFKGGAQQTFARALSWYGAKLSTTDGRHIPVGDATFSDTDQTMGGIDTEQKEDQSQFKMVHDPGHPDADENGYVKMPNVNVVTEMVDMIAASRAFEANVTALSAAKGIAKDSLEI